MKKHLNDQLYEIIVAGIRDGRLQAGTLLLEGALAELFEVSRSPVRQALTRLCTEGLICTFDGRGYLVGKTPGPVIRRKLDADFLGALSKGDRPRKVESWQGVYDDIERELLHHSLFGSYRINELELSRYYGVSRTVTNQVLTRLHLHGLTERDERSRWLLTKWNERRLGEIYEIRRRLEPYALMRAAEYIPAAKVGLFIKRLVRAVELYPSMESRHFDDLETDLHIRTLGYCPNQEMLKMLRRTHSFLLSGKHILLDKTYFPEEEPFFQEHLEIFDALHRGRPELAAQSMEGHLLIAEAKVGQRLAYFKSHNTVEDVPYLERLPG